MILYLCKTATATAILTHAAVQVDTFFIHCQACTAVRDFVLPLSFVQKYFVLNQLPHVMATSSILLHRQCHVLEAWCSIRVGAPCTGYVDSQELPALLLVSGQPVPQAAV